MQANKIVYADLSTYTPRETMSFYQDVFGWKFVNVQGQYLAFTDNQLVAGLYETPERFKRMSMPHFWMTYIQVDDADSIVLKARALGGVIEADEVIQDFGRIALIRDPQGAGFTIYEGDRLECTRTVNQANTLIWNELHVSSIQSIIPFYEGVFNWNFVKKGQDCWEMHHDQNVYIADAREIANKYKGKYEYWICTFGVHSLETTRTKILALGGSLVQDDGKRILFADHSGQAFFYVQEVFFGKPEIGVGSGH